MRELGDMWTRYDVEWRFVCRLCGSVPANPDLQKIWLESRQPKTRPEEGRGLEELGEEVEGSTEEVQSEEQGLYVFQRQHVEGLDGLVMRAGTVRAHIKECSRTLSGMYFKKVEKGSGDKSFAVRALNAVYYPVEQYWIPILGQGDGGQVKEASGTHDKPIQVKTQRGPRSALKTYEYIENAMMKFQLAIMTQAGGRLVVSEEELGQVFNYGGVHGYGGERGDGEGRYVWKLTRAGDEH